MEKKYLLKSSLVFALLMAFCIKALAQDDIPKERSYFYMENGKTKAFKASTRADDKKHWAFKSVIENCFDTKLLGKEAWMMTADGATKLKVTFEYTNNDDSYNIASSDVEFCFYKGDDLFNDEYIALDADPKVVGTFTKEESKKAVTLYLTAPEAFPDPDISWYAYYVIIRLKLEDGRTAAAAKQIGITRNGLFLLHGLNSDRMCFAPYRDYLRNTAKIYLSSQIYVQDYSSTNTSSFYDNTHKNNVVKNGLLKLSESLFKAGIASTKYDMIGHSMGGILERLYIQEVDDEHTNRLITLNTPHFGSILGNIFIDYDEFRQTPGVGYYRAIEKFNALLDKAFSRDRSMQAVKDLAKNSPAIQRLASKREALYGIPVCAVGSEISKWGLTFAVKEGFYAIFPKIASFLFDAKPGTGKAYLDKQAEKGSDYVVSVESQKGGCEYSYIYKGGYTQAMHCHVTEWNIIHEELTKLLTATDTYHIFSTEGFGDIPSSAGTRAEEEKIELVKGFEEPKSTSFIKIEAKKVDGADYTHELKLTTSSDMMTKVAFCLLNEDEMIADYEKDEMHFNMSGIEGEKWIYAIGRTDYNALVIDSVKVTLGGTDGIKSVENDEELRYTVTGNSLNIQNLSEPYSISVYNYAGQMLSEMRSNPAHYYTLPRSKGLLIVSIRSNKGKQFLKVMSK